MPDLFIAAFMLGLLGSFHCIGMCGPIALSLPLAGLEGPARIYGISAYNAGRVSTYALGGAIFGALGMGVRLAGYQQLLSIALGVLLLAHLFSPRWLPTLSGGSKILQSISSGFKKRFSRQFRRSGLGALFASGILNGLLPCGLVYAALTGAAASGHIGYGALFMAGFGLGTLPAMFGISYFAGISPKVRSSLRKTTPLITGIMAGLLILRGLGLGIPYMSPKVQKNEIPMCHTPAPFQY